ncbi:MAG: tetratricopeptide repeat protein [Nitrosospira sp.]|nr:tetratricopeptide repeat protein [Nitrosospira sp.]
MVGSFVLVLFSSLALAKTPEQIFAQVSPSVVGVDMIDAHGKSIGQGSGVVTGEGQVLTACHVVKAGKNGQVHQAGKTFEATLATRAQVVSAMTKKDELDWLNRIIALEKKGEWRALLKLAQQEIKRDPTNASAWYSVGVASAHLKHYREAVHAYREAIRNQADYDEAWHKLGIAYANLREYHHAVHAYREALRIRSENAGAWHDLGNAYHELKQYAHAIHAYREALRIQPENAGAWYGLGIT